MISLDNYQELRRKAEGLIRRQDETRGRLRELKLQLKKEFGCNTVAEARQLEAKLFQELQSVLKQWNKAREAFAQQLSLVEDRLRTAENSHRMAEDSGGLEE